MGVVVIVGEVLVRWLGDGQALLISTDQRRGQGHVCTSTHLRLTGQAHSQNTPWTHLIHVQT